LEARLIQEAEHQGMPVDELAMRLLEQQLPLKDRAAAAVALLQSWMEDEDVEEQRETGDYLIRALDEDRPSERKLFPPELKGVSW
jgi:hypothetical protein